MENKNKPAFSKSAFYHPDGGIDAPQEGLTKREYFAGLIIQGILASNDTKQFTDGGYQSKDQYHNRIVEASITLADKLLTQLEKEQRP